MYQMVKRPRVVTSGVGDYWGAVRGKMSILQTTSSLQAIS